MKPIQTIFAVSLSISLAVAALAQGSGKTLPVTFAKGATSTTIKGQIKGDAYIDYTIKAGAGQTLALNLKGTSPQNYMNVIPGRSEEALFIGSSSGNAMNAVLPDDGVYKVRVYLMRAAARRGATSKYTLTVSLTGKALAPIAASADALVPTRKERFNALRNCTRRLRSVRHSSYGVALMGPPPSSCERAASCAVSSLSRAGQ